MRMRRTGRMLEPLGHPLPPNGPMMRMYARPDCLGLRHERLDAAEPRGVAVAVAPASAKSVSSVQNPPFLNSEPRLSTPLPTHRDPTSSGASAPRCANGTSTARVSKQEREDALSIGVAVVAIRQVGRRTLPAA